MRDEEIFFNFTHNEYRASEGQTNIVKGTNNIKFGQ